MNHPLFIGSARGTHERISEACGTQVMAVALADIHGAESLARLMAARPSTPAGFTLPPALPTRIL